MVDSGTGAAVQTDTAACPKCGSEKISRSQRRGVQEAVVLKREGVSPYRCQDCGERFMRRSRHKGRSRRHTLAGRLGIRDLKARRRIMRMTIAAVMTLIAIFTALMLFGYFTRPVAPPPDMGASLSPGGTA